MKRLLALSIVAAALFPASAAGAAGTQNVIAHSTGGYANPAVVIEEGDALDFTNADPLGINHNLVEESGTRFGSTTVSSGTVPVDGVESLAPGSYQFFCSLHPWMKGVLQVEPSLPTTPPRLEVPSADGPAPIVALPGGIVPTPTAVHATADALYVASYAQGGVVRLPIVEGGLLGVPETVASGFTNPLGVVVDDDGTVFVADSHAGPDGRTVGRVQAVVGDGTQLVVDGLPNGRHNTNNLAIHGGRLYIANGNATDDGINGGSPELPLNGTLLSVGVTARDLVVGPDGAAVDGITVEATGMRNVYDVAIRPGTNEAWLTTNGPDTFDPYGEDTLVKVDDVTSEIAPDFGFPECLYDAAGTILDNPVTPGTCGAHTPPAALLGLHVSADGMAFGPDGHAYIALFGNFFGNEVVGHKVVRVPIDASGTVTGPPEDVAVSAAPLDLTFGDAGLYVADFATGTILLQVL